MTDTVRPAQLEARQIGALIEAKLIEWNISYEFVEEFPIADVRVVSTTQVRDAEHQVNAEQVDQYAEHMRQGVVFPPIVVMGEHVLIDGNTRVAAARKVRIATLPAFRCQFPNGDLAMAFAAAMNMMNGRRLSMDEAHRQAQVLMRYRYTDDAIARELGYGRTQINNWRREAEAAERAERTMVTDRLEAIGRSERRKLAGVKLDAPFAAAVDLVAALKPKASEVTKLVKAVQTAPSEADALQIVAEARNDLTPAGPPPHRPARTAEQVAAARALPQLVKLAGRATALVESDPERREAWVTSWRTVGELAGEVVALHG